MARKFTTQKENEVAYFKANIYGPPGSGKTYTSLLLAEGLRDYERAKGKTGAEIFLLDTERGADHYLSRFKTYGPESGTRSIRDAFDLIDEIEKNPELAGSVLVLDSVTHIWEQVQLDYITEKGISDDDLQISDWGPLKKPWKELMRRIVAGQFHSILCGRQGDAQENVWDQRRGKMVMLFTGYKMKAEKEAMHEPHFVGRMEQFNVDNDGVTDPRKMKKSVDPTKIAHRLIVEKDRSGAVQGMSITNPDFDDIRPVLERAGTKHGGMASPEDSAARDHGMFEEKKWTVEEAVAELEGCGTAVKLAECWRKNANTWKRQLGEVGFEKITNAKDDFKGRFAAEVAA